MWLCIFVGNSGWYKILFLPLLEALDRHMTGRKLSKRLNDKDFSLLIVGKPCMSFIPRVSL